MRSDMRDVPDFLWREEDLYVKADVATNSGAIPTAVPIQTRPHPPARQTPPPSAWGNRFAVGPKPPDPEQPLLTIRQGP